MKDLFNQLLETIEITVFDPFRFLEMQENRKKNLSITEKIIILLAAISVAAGSIYLTPPYSGSFMYSIPATSLLLFLFLGILPGFMGAFLDYSIRFRKDRKDHLLAMVHGAKILLVVFIFFMPVAVVLVQFGVSGGWAYFLLLLFFIAFYIYLLGNLTSILYEIKPVEALAISAKVFLTTLAFPLLFDFVFGHSLVTLIK